MPTPAVAHLTKSMGCGAGIMLTASHNPYEDNGLKIFGPDGFKLSDDLEALVEQEVLYDVKANGVTGDKIGKAYRIDDARGCGGAQFRIRILLQNRGVQPCCAGVRLPIHAVVDRAA